MKNMIQIIKMTNFNRIIVDNHIKHHHNSIKPQIIKMPPALKEIQSLHSKPSKKNPKM